MKRLFTFIIVLSLLVLGGTLVSANSQTRWNNSLTTSIPKTEPMQNPQ